nr:hypothetical protein LRH_12894 [Lacticaseibacillus rhamnosus HN001]
MGEQVSFTKVYILVVKHQLEAELYPDKD